MSNREVVEKLWELHKAGVISRKTLLYGAGLHELADEAERNRLDMDIDPDGMAKVAGFEECDDEDFLERTYPVGSLIRPSGFLEGAINTVNISLANKPGGKPYTGSRRAPFYVEVSCQDLWTVVQHRSGWTKIVSSDGQHSGWTFYVRDYFQLA